MRFRPIAFLAVCLALVPWSTAVGAESATTAPRPPKAKTLGAEPLAKRQELVFGYVKTYGAATRCRIEFGRTKAYGHYAYDYEHPYGWNEASYAEVEALAAHLRPNATYHYRVVGWNERGKSFGRDMTFRTGQRGSSTG